MITISHNAAKQVKQILAAENKSPNSAVKVSVVSGGCSGLSYKLDFVEEIDPSFEKFSDKDILLVCDKKSFFYLIGTELDYSEGLNGSGFAFKNPNAERTCACGESFSL